MTQILRYVEEISLGLIYDDHTERRLLLTERVTVCPSCKSLRTLRHEGGTIQCAACDWEARPTETPVAA